jgi:FKBP-type peptidyl-prolyl cis-trans isomerase SlyD
MSKQVITFHYELKGEAGEIIDSSKGGEPMSFLEGVGQIIDGLETVLLKMEPGVSKEIKINYQDAYGAYDQALVARVPRSQFPSDQLKKRDVFQIEKEGQVRLISVVEFDNDIVTIDANHPMAGKNLNFWIQLVEKRGASAEEIAHGHVHGAGGHHH